jgi:hypothetical protein
LGTFVFGIAFDPMGLEALETGNIYNCLSWCEKCTSKIQTNRYANSQKRVPAFWSNIPKTSRMVNLESFAANTEYRVLNVDWPAAVVASNCLAPVVEERIPRVLHLVAQHLGIQQGEVVQAWHIVPAFLTKANAKLYILCP